MLKAQAELQAVYDKKVFDLEIKGHFEVSHESFPEIKNSLQLLNLLKTKESKDKVQICKDFNVSLPPKKIEKIKFRTQGTQTNDEQFKAFLKSQKQQTKETKPKEIKEKSQKNKSKKEPLSNLDAEGALKSNTKRPPPEPQEADKAIKDKGEKKKKVGKKLAVDKEVFKGKPKVEPLPTKSSNGLDIDDLM